MEKKQKKNIVAFSIFYIVLTLFLIYIITAIQMNYIMNLSSLSLGDKISGVLDYDLYIKLPLGFFDSEEHIKNIIYISHVIALFFLVVGYASIYIYLSTRNEWKNKEHGSAEWGRKIDRIQYKLNSPFEIKYKVTPIQHKLNELNKEIREAKQKKHKELLKKLNLKKSQLLEEKKEKNLLIKDKILTSEIEILKELLKRK